MLSKKWRAPHYHLWDKMELRFDRICHEHTTNRLFYKALQIVYLNVVLSDAKLLERIGSFTFYSILMGGGVLSYEESKCSRKCTEEHNTH